MIDPTSITEFPANRACCSKQGLMLMHCYMIRRNRMEMHNSHFCFVRGMSCLCCSSYLSEEAEDVGVASDAIRVLLQVILQHNTSDVHTLYTRTCTSYNSQNAKIAALMCPCNRTQYHIYREPPAERVFAKKVPHHSYHSRALTNQKHCVQSGVFL